VILVYERRVFQANLALRRRAKSISPVLGIVITLKTLKKSRYAISSV
jgi:hypothetical protein